MFCLMLEFDFCYMQYTQYLLFRGVNANLHDRINLIVLQTALKLNNVSGLRIGGLVINATEMSCHALFMLSKFDIHLYTFSWNDLRHTHSFSLLESELLFCLLFASVFFNSHLR